MTARRRRASNGWYVLELERRCLLAAQPTAVWLGQDGHDLVGANPIGPDGIQDVHVAISGLPTGLSVAKVSILGDGGGLWEYHGVLNQFAASWARSPGASTADLYFEPYMVEVGRQFWIDLTYTDGSTDEIWLTGGRADPNLRMPDATVQIQWIGQDGHDLTGPGPDVGPDGIQDVHLALAQLSTTTPVTSVTVDSSSGSSWSSGINPGLASNAELVPQAGDPARADFYFNPVAGLSGQTLTLTVAYADGRSDQMSIIAGASDSTLRMAAPAAVAIDWNTIHATWVGQDGLDLTGPGDVHVALTGIPAGRSVVSAMLTDPIGADWVVAQKGAPASTVDPFASALRFRDSKADPSAADLGFSPIRDESHSTLTLRVILDDGSMLATEFGGGPSDLSRLAPAGALSTIVAHAGDDLNALANQYGVVHLAPGTYPLDAPLVLDHPVTITADPGVTLLFTQSASAPTWTEAIQVACGNTTLNGFAVRFSGPVRWTAGVNYGPAVIGTPDGVDAAPRSTLVDISLTHLDLESPPAATSWEEAVGLIRLAGARAGTIADNVLKGGATVVFGGPWQILGNDYQGTMPGTFTDEAFGSQYTHDVVISGNHAQPVGPSGKTWRFLVLTQQGADDLVQNNTVVGIGMLDSDTEPNPNAPEVILTESYRLHFEGRPSALSPDGRIIQVPSPQGGSARSGDVLSILSGPDAGQWRLIAQAIGPSVYLLDRPLSPDDLAVSISTGFVGETFEGNTVDTSGSTTAQDLVLAGNHFGTRVVGNTLIGGAQALRIVAAATESPVAWGWSHAPFLGGVIEGNTIQDAGQGAVLVVEHGAAIRSNAGRVYLSVTLDDNTIAWSTAFLNAHAGTTPPAIIVGDPRAHDPGELQISESGNEVQQPTSSTDVAVLAIDAATVNGQALRGTSIPLPNVLAAPTGLRLVTDTGASASDGITSDGRVRLDPVLRASGYEYAFSADGPYAGASSRDGFVPQGLVQGTNTLFVRACDASGRRGPSASLTFVEDSVAPLAVNGLVALPDGSVRFQGTDARDQYAYQVGGTSTWIALGHATSFSSPEMSQGTRTVEVVAIDLAGNVGPATLATITPRPVPVTQAPPPSPGPSPSASPPRSVSPAVSTTPDPSAPTLPSTSKVYGQTWNRHVGAWHRPLITLGRIIPPGPVRTHPPALRHPARRRH